MFNFESFFITICAFASLLLWLGFAIWLGGKISDSSGNDGLGLIATLVIAAGLPVSILVGCTS